MLLYTLTTLSNSPGWFSLFTWYRKWSAFNDEKRDMGHFKMRQSIPKQIFYDFAWLVLKILNVTVRLF